MTTVLLTTIAALLVNSLFLFKPLSGTDGMTYDTNTNNFNDFSISTKHLITIQKQFGAFYFLDKCITMSSYDYSPFNNSCCASYK